jgi:hypothetical protein
MHIYSAAAPQAWGILAAAAAAAWDERHGRIPTASLADQCCAGKGAWWAVNIAGG